MKEQHTENGAYAQPHVYQLGTVGTVLDEVHKPEWREKIHEFDSILAESQTAGRGQYRRNWCSPCGNIYAAVRLPMDDPFKGTEAAVAVGTWLAEGLRALGYPCLLKWPNDIVLAEDGTEDGSGPCKVCGILLEERDKRLYAGIGINVHHFPQKDDMREGAALPAGCLADYAARHGLAELPLAALWKSLVNSLFSSYTHDKCKAPGGWREKAFQLLLWRDNMVTVDDGDTSVSGRLCGIGPGGELMLSSQGCVRQFLSGSIRRA